MKKVFYILFLIPLFYLSCSTNKDAMDVYTGKWNYTAVGLMTFTKNSGSVFLTQSVDTASYVEVINMGSEVLNIGGLPVKVSGTSLTIPSASDSTTVGGITKKTVYSYEGTITTNKIIIVQSYAGTWSNPAFSGSIGGSVIYTFTR